jgi:hypothetical protein
MSRNSISSTGIGGPIPDSYVTASNQNVRVAYAAYCDFSTGTVRAWTGLNNITLQDDFGGGIYTALGNFAAIGNSQEVNDITSKTYELSVSGIPSDQIYLALNDNYRGRYVAIYMLLFTPDCVSYQQVTVFKGWMDQMTITESGTTSTIKISCESRLIQFENPIEQWYTDQFQQMLYPGDLGLQYVTSLATQDIYWGSAAPGSGNVVAGSIGSSAGGGSNVSPGNRVLP